MINQNPAADTTTATGWPGYTPEELAWFAETYGDTEWAVHVIGPDDVHVNEPDAQGEHNPDGAPLTEQSAWALADSVRKFNAWYRAKFGEKPCYTEDLIPNVFHRGVPVETRPAQEGPSPRTLVSADEDDAVHVAPQGRVECGAPAGGAPRLASVTCRDCLDAFHAPAAPRPFRVGDLVEIAGRDGEDVNTSSGAALNGKTGVVAEIDDNPEYPIGLQVEGYVGLVWCSSTEIRHADPASVATSESGAAR